MPPPLWPGQWAMPRPMPRPPSELKSLWIGEIQTEWTEEYVQGLLSDCGKQFYVKLIPGRGYGFVEFESHADAAEVLQRYADRQIPGHDHLRFALRWGGGHGRVAPKPQDSSLFVGDLDYKVTESQLAQAFKRYASFVSAKLVVDPASGASKGFGFVRFGDAAERDRAMEEMTGFRIGERPIRCTAATAREDKPVAPMPKTTDEGENTCVFVGGLDESVTPDMLRHHFGLLGDIAYIRIPAGRGCGFVGFVHRKNAEAAISTLQGLRINGYKVRLSWGSMRSGPKNTRPAQNLAGPRPIVPAVNQVIVKKDHRTPYGALTCDFIDDLPEPKPVWTVDKKPPPSDAVNNDAVPSQEAPVVPAVVPVSPYVAQLKARYETYAAAARDPPKPPLSTAPKDEELPGDCYSHYSTRTSRPCKRAMSLDDRRAEDHLFTTKFLRRTLSALTSGLVLPLETPKPLHELYDHITDTPMAAYVKEAAAAKAR